MGLSECFQNISLSTCIWFETGDKRNAYASMLAGFLFFSGWWAIIDAGSTSSLILPGYHMCGVVGTLSLIMVNSVSNAQMRGDVYEGGCMGPRGTRVWLFLGFVLGFSSVIASCWILFENFMEEGHRAAGVSLFLQNALIFVSSIIYKFGRSEDLWG